MTTDDPRPTQPAEPPRDDEFQSFLAEYLARIERDGSAAIDDFRAHHPEFASRLGHQLEWLAEHLGRRKGALPDRIGPYRVMQHLGSGGMGEVYLAEQTTPFRRVVAVKVIKIGKQDDARAQRFATEIQLLALLNHNGIAKVFEAGSDEGKPYFAMEYVPGKSITSYCTEQRLDVKQRLQLFLEVCRAVEHAHRHGILHRDLKPSNLLVYGPPEQAVVKVIDFGLARMVEPEPGALLQTQTAGIVGTPDYMSPEQVGAAGERRVDTRADVYALGVVLYELLTGVLPLSLCDLGVKDIQALVKAIREREPSSPSVRVEESESQSETSPSACTGMSPHKLSRLLAGDLDAIVMKALAKDADQRYGSVTQLADDITKSLRHEPVSSRQRTTAYVLQKFARRHRAAVLFATTIAVVLATSLVLLGLQTLQTMRHLERGGLFGMAHRLTELHLAEGTPPPPRPEHREELAMRLREYTSILAQRGRMEALLAAPPRSTRSGDWSDEASLDAPLHAALSATVDLLAKMNRPGAEFDQLRLRVDWAARVTERTIDAHRADWERVCREVHDEPRYGFDLTPQVGLVPLGPDPVTHLQEFALLLPDGEVPQRVDGKLVLGPRTCPVFVLLPGGKVMLGGQNTDPADIHYDQRLSPTEDPLVDATLPPFFAGKFEFTNGHWALALGGKHHSEPPELYDDPLRPVVNLDEDWMTQVLLAWGMRFPTWQEWEYLARGGTDTPFAYGTDNASLRGHANLLDLTARAAEPSLGEGEPEQWPDNFERTAPVGSFPPNGFGLYDVHGNALEPALRLELDGQRQFDLRGGSWNQPAIRARILFAPKWTQGPMESIGFRPVISVSR